MAFKVLLIGTGITSAVTGAILRKKCNEQIKLTIWDKAKGTGGRMSTSRSPTNNDCFADLGAQYITTSPETFLAHQDIYNSLISNGLLEPLSAHIDGLKVFPKETKHFVAPSGMSSLVKHLFIGVPDEMYFNYHVNSITEEGKKWKVATNSGVEELFDIVILTIPVPQILQLSGSIQEVISRNQALKDGLNATHYSSRYALGLFLDNAGSKSQATPDMSWAVKYISDDTIVRYIAFDNKKRNRQSQPAAIVIHTSTTFGDKHIDKTTNEMEPFLMEHVQKLFPDLPQPQSVKCHKWKFSQVVDPFPGSPGCFSLMNKPLLIAGGDGFSKSNFDGCIFSALKVTNEVVSYIELGSKET